MNQCNRYIDLVSRLCRLYPGTTRFRGRVAVARGRRRVAQHQLNLGIVFHGAIGSGMNWYFQNNINYQDESAQNADLGFFGFTLGVGMTY